MDGAVAPLTQALVRVMVPDGRQAPARKIADFLKRYADEARQAGKTDELLGDLPGPLDVLKRLEPGIFGELTETGAARTRDVAPAAIDLPADAFSAGAMSPEAEAGAAVAEAELRQAAADGPFGPVLEGYEGDWRGAVEELTRRQTGEAPGALSHPDIGPIALVWGQENRRGSPGYGLAKIRKKHPEVVSDLQGVLDRAAIVSRSENRIVLESPTEKAVVRLEWDGQEKTWLMTAYEKQRGTERTTGRLDSLPEGSSPKGASPSAPLPAKDSVSAPDFQDDAMSEIRATVEAWQRDGGDFELTLSGDGPEKVTASLREILDDLDADDALATVVDLCAVGGTA